MRKKSTDQKTVINFAFSRHLCITTGRGSSDDVTGNGRLFITCTGYIRHLSLPKEKESSKISIEMNQFKCGT